MAYPWKLKDPAPFLAEFTALLNAATAATLPCKGGTEWFSEDPRIQRRAAELCRPCTLLMICRTYAIAAGERTGAWGGTTSEARSLLGRKATA